MGTRRIEQQVERQVQVEKTEGKQQRKKKVRGLVDVSELMALPAMSWPEKTTTVYQSEHPHGYDSSDNP